MAEWLRRLTRNQIPSGSVGSSPTDRESYFFFQRNKNVILAYLSELFFPDKKSKYLHARKVRRSLSSFLLSFLAFRQEFANKCPTLGKDVCCYCSYFLFKGHLAFIEEPLEYQTSTHWAKPDFQNFILWLPKFIFLKSNSQQNSPFWSPIFTKIHLLEV